ncbi:MAG: hypothetical protein JWO36_5608 [Myxococcales bacterium]|nr:hypothetical protein [Myxococcales bacterium]
MMPRWQRAYVIAMCALIAGAFAYAACDWGLWPRLTYLPLSEELVMKAPAGALSVTYYGIVAWGAGGFAVGALVGAALCAIVRKPWPDRVLQLFGAWAITAVLLAGSYFTWSVWPW